MSLTENKEREKLLQWAKEQEDKAVFAEEFDEKKESYYRNRSFERDNIWEYAPDNVNDFIAQCQDVWEKIPTNGVLKILAIAILKAEPKSSKEQDAGMEIDLQCNDKIPEYIYVF